MPIRLERKMDTAIKNKKISRLHAIKIFDGGGKAREDIINWIQSQYGDFLSSPMRKFAMSEFASKSTILDFYCNNKTQLNIGWSCFSEPIMENCLIKGLDLTNWLKSKGCLEIGKEFAWINKENNFRTIVCTCTILAHDLQISHIGTNLSNWIQSYGKKLFKIFAWSNFGIFNSHVPPWNVSISPAAFRNLLAKPKFHFLVHVMDMACWLQSFGHRIANDNFYLFLQRPPKELDRITDHDLSRISRISIKLTCISCYIKRLTVIELDADFASNDVTVPLELKISHSQIDEMNVFLDGKICYNFKSCVIDSLNFI